MFVGSIAFIAPSQEAVSPTTNHDPGLKLIVTAPSQSYVLGEVVPLSIELKRDREPDNSDGDAKSGKYGYLHISIAGDDRLFREYYGPGIQVGGDEINLRLRSGESYRTTTAVLWNGKPNIAATGDLRDKNNRILTDYAFPTSGIYFVKATITTSADEKTPEKIESEPIQIIVNEPLSDELRVWDRIKNKSEIAYFMQQGDFQIYKSEEKEKLLKDIRQIIQKYPNSILANQMEASLGKYEIIEAKIKQQKKN